MTREEAKQRIIDGALAWMEKDMEFGEPPMHWTARELDAALSDTHWNEGFPIDFDLGTVADTINGLWKERHPDLRTSKEVDGKEPPESGLQDGEESAPNGTPYLLPIAGMDGYSVDPYGRVHAAKKRGREAGPLIPDKFFQKKGAGKSPRFVCGYRVRVGDKRKRFRPNYFLMARYFAEQKWLNGED